MSLKEPSASCPVFSQGKEKAKEVNEKKNLNADAIPSSPMRCCQKRFLFAAC